MNDELLKTMRDEVDKCADISPPRRAIVALKDSDGLYYVMCSQYHCWSVMRVRNPWYIVCPTCCPPQICSICHGSKQLYNRSIKMMENCSNCKGEGEL